MQDQTTLLSNPRDFALDLLNFAAEQIELAKANPADQLAAIDAASGVIPVLKNRLDDDLKSIFGIVLQNRFDRSWREEWDELAAMQPHEEFRGAAEALLREINSTAMGLDGPLGRSQRVADLLVEFAANDEFENLPLARRQRCETGPNAVHGALLIARCSLMR